MTPVHELPLVFAAMLRPHFIEQRHFGVGEMPESFPDLFPVEMLRRGPQEGGWRGIALLAPVIRGRIPEQLARPISLPAGRGRYEVGRQRESGGPGGADQRPADIAML